ncbi:MAG: hypothetical protein IPK60_25380 [Sandaracinaceae bacterium]|nr:hypothetical protein [Sandaracinaceae bacterium]
MKNAIIGVLLAGFAIGMFAFVADAQQRGRRGRGAGRRQTPSKVQEAPQSAHIAQSMGELHWGMTKQEVYTLFQNQIRERFRPLLAKAPGAIEEDRLRAEMNEELRRLHDEDTCFRGRRTGWDASFLADEFTHNNNECMLVRRDANSQNFYFFINDHLWKWYKAFDASVFAGQTFAQFAGALQGRFGQAREATGEIATGRGTRHWLEWQDSNSRLRAIDLTSFYGFFCLVFEEKATIDNLATLRANAPNTGARQRTLVDSVTSGENEPANPDSNPDIVDRITGRIRNRQDAPEDGGRPRDAGPGASRAAPPPPPANPGQDPLLGL